MSREKSRPQLAHDILGPTSQSVVDFDKSLEDSFHRFPIWGGLNRALDDAGKDIGMSIMGVEGFLRRRFKRMERTKRFKKDLNGIFNRLRAYSLNPKRLMHGREFPLQILENDTLSRVVDIFPAAASILDEVQAFSKFLTVDSGRSKRRLLAFSQLLALFNLGPVASFCINTQRTDKGVKMADSIVDFGSIAGYSDRLNDSNYPNHKKKRVAEDFIQMYEAQPSDRAHRVLRRGHRVLEPAGQAAGQALQGVAKVEGKLGRNTPLLGDFIDEARSGLKLIQSAAELAAHAPVSMQEHVEVILRDSAEKINEINLLIQNGNATQGDYITLARMSLANYVATNLDNLYRTALIYAPKPAPEGQQGN